MNCKIVEACLSAIHDSKFKDLNIRLDYLDRLSSKTIFKYSTNRVEGINLFTDPRYLVSDIYCEKIYHRVLDIINNIYSDLTTSTDKNDIFTFGRLSNNRDYYKLSDIFAIKTDAKREVISSNSEFDVSLCLIYSFNSHIIQIYEDVDIEVFEAIETENKFRELNEKV